MHYFPLSDSKTDDSANNFFFNEYKEITIDGIIGPGVENSSSFVHHSKASSRRAQKFTGLTLGPGHRFQYQQCHSLLTEALESTTLVSLNI